MRLIDADKQLECVDCMKPIHGIGLEPVVAVETVRDLVKGSPTIDAIPMEWLREWQDEVGTINEWWPIIERIITVWREEQEAQDGKA